MANPKQGSLSQKRPEPAVIPVERQWVGFLGERLYPEEAERTQTTGFYAFDVGIRFYKLLDNFNDLLLQAGQPPSSVDRFLAVLQPHQTTLYVNDMFDYSIRIRGKNDLNAGQSVKPEDLAEIERVRLHGVKLPPEAGIVLLLSHNWRKAFYFDFRPCLPESAYRIDYDMEIIAGQMLAYLMFTEYFLLSEKDWDSIIEAEWFPFMYLIGNLWDGLLQCIQAGESTKEYEDQIHHAFLADIDVRLRSWLRKAPLAAEEPILTRAVGAYKAGDWITVVCLLYPRIEAILRWSVSWQGESMDIVRALADQLEKSTHQRSLLFPQHLEAFFNRLIFQDWDPAGGLGRMHSETLRRGIVPAASMTRDKALKLLLLVDQLYYCLPNETQ